MLTVEQVLAEPCTSCGSKPSRPCVNGNGWVVHPHLARMYDARRTVGRAATVERMRARLNEREEEQP